MKNLKKFAALLLLLSLPLQASATETAGADWEALVGVYEMESIPTSWDPTQELDADQQALLELTTDRLYRKENGKLIPSLAASMPRDVTAEYAGQYGVPQNAARGYVFAVDLKEDACWEDGMPVTAGDYRFTIMKMLETGSFSLDIAGYAAAKQGSLRAGSGVVSLREAGYGSVNAAVEQGVTEFFVDVQHFWGLDEGWVSADSRQRLMDTSIPSGLDEMYVSGAYLFREYLADGGQQSVFQTEFVGIAAAAGDAYTMEDVGLLEAEQQLILILERPATAAEVAMALEDVTVLRQECYGADYGTGANYSSCGPYRIVSATAEEIVLKKNLHWAGSAQTFEPETIRCVPAPEIGA